MNAWTPEEIRRRAAQFEYWHYAFDLGDDILTQPGHGDARRQWQRLAHVFSPLLHLAGGSLEGLTVLDVGCNQGFWSIEAAKAGASSVFGIEGRPEHVEAARFVADVLDIKNATFETLNVYDPALLRQEPFDVVLCLGLLYHVDRPLELLDRLQRLTRRWLVVDTSVVDVNAALLHLVLEDPQDPRNAVGDGLVAVPSRQAVERLLWHVGFDAVWRVPQRSEDLPPAYLEGRRATWIAGQGEWIPAAVDQDLLQPVPSNRQLAQQVDLLNPLAAESPRRFLREKLRQASYRRRRGR